MIKKLKDGSLFATDTFIKEHPQMFKFLESASPGQYDKIMDSAYRATHIGGGGHRAFDGVHTLGGSWDAIKQQTGSVDLVKYLKAHFNELVTPEGIPLFTLNHKQYQLLSEDISEKLGGIVSGGEVRSYIRDLNSVNLGDVLSCGLGGLFLFFAFRSKDPIAISRVTAANLTLGLATANPLMVVSGLCALGMGLYMGKIKSFELLKGSAPVLTGWAAGKMAKDLFQIGSNGSVFISIAAYAACQMWITHLDKKKQEKIKRELGAKNPHYMAVMNPAILRQELNKISLKQPRLGLATAL